MSPYYRFGAQPQQWVADWKGHAYGAQPRGGEHAQLADYDVYRVSLGKGSVRHSGPEQASINDQESVLEGVADVLKNKWVLAGAGVLALCVFMRRK